MEKIKIRRVLDLFCGAGGASQGLRRAFPGAEIVGVDIKEQPRYPFKFVRADAMAYPLDYDFIWASPPCQHYCNGSKQMRTYQNYPDLIAPMRDRLKKTNAWWVIENIVGAKSKLINPVMLCGEMFGLGVFRHRLFEANFFIPVPPHKKHVGRVGDGRIFTVTGHSGGSSKRDCVKYGGVKDWRIAMDIAWMSAAELSQSIPPAYSEYIAKQSEKRFSLGARINRSGMSAALKKIAG